ncbi:uncharacterized protein LOC122044545 [Zingiber officinale]|uniref:uncharacterized protein LOC122044545 n=1 Tax=Zingiber officinale TaxID=94328 RepID=UPI001C4ABCA5|nr:uncharacterized protein LOC122044545 [Zingiber officinale]
MNEECSNYMSSDKQYVKELKVLPVEHRGEVFEVEYLRRPNATDIQHLLEMHEQRHVSLACWAVLTVCIDNGKIAPSLGKIWHAFFGIAGSGNDINVLNESSLFNDVLQGNAPEDPKRKIFKEWQEAARKDVDRAFGVFQSRWAMIRGPGRFWYQDNLKNIIYTCIILHNMIIENDGDAVIYWSDDKGDPQSQIFQGSTQEFQAYIRRNYELRDNQLHY